MIIAHKKCVLAITDSVEMGFCLQSILSRDFGGRVNVFSMTFAECQTFLTAKRIEETDLFVLELFRSYAGGPRAEGVVFARRLRHRTRFLIISALHLSKELKCFRYWDTAAEDTLGERARDVLNAPDVYADGLDRLEKCFERLLKVPQQHFTSSS